MIGLVPATREACGLSTGSHYQFVSSRKACEQRYSTLPLTYGLDVQPAQFVVFIQHGYPQGYQQPYAQLINSFIHRIIHRLLYKTVVRLSRQVS